MWLLQLNATPRLVRHLAFYLGGSKALRAKSEVDLQTTNKGVTANFTAVILRYMEMRLFAVSL